MKGQDLAGKTVLKLVTGHSEVIFGSCYNLSERRLDYVPVCVQVNIREFMQSASYLQKGVKTLDPI